MKKFLQLARELKYELNCTTNILLINKELIIFKNWYVDGNDDNIYVVLKVKEDSKTIRLM